MNVAAPASATWISSRPQDLVLEDIREAARRNAGVLSGNAYDRLRGPESLSAVRVMQLFGTWNEACAAAGVDPGEALRTVYDRTWTPDELIGWVVAFYDTFPARGSYRVLDAWLRIQPGAPSAQTIRNQCGLTKWSKIAARALELRAERDSGPSAPRRGELAQEEA